VDDASCDLYAFAALKGTNLSYLAILFCGLVLLALALGKELD
jgi:hypothetical protein